MAADIGWFRRCLHNISNEIDVINSLSEIKIALTSLSYIQLKTLALNLDLGVIFDCLNSSDNLQIELGCNVLVDFLPCLEPSVLLNKYGVAMHRALAHPNEEVKKVVLTEMCRAVRDSDLVSRMGDQQALLLSVVDCIGHEDMSVAKIAISFLVWMGQTPSYLVTLFSPQLMCAFNTVKRKNDTTRYRVYEVIVEVSSISTPGLEASHKSGLLTELLEEAKQKKDILTKLTAIELITKLALTYHGMEYLEQHGLTGLLAEEIINCQDNSLEALIVPGIMKFFGNIAQFWPKEVFNKYSKVIGAVFEFLNSSQSNFSAIALETIGYVATTPEGKLCLQNHGDSMTIVMQKLYQLITSAPADVRIRPLNTVANIIGLEISDQTSELLELTEKWYSSMSDGNNPTQCIMSTCHLPFPEQKLAGFLILQKLSEQVWGQQHILNCPGLIEFLLDRDVEPTMQCKTSKFKIVQTLTESHTAESVFGEYLFKKLVDFVKEGPCYVRTQTEVAIEGAA